MAAMYEGSTGPEGTSVSPKVTAVTTFSYVTFTSAVAVCHAEVWLAEVDQVGVSEGGEWSGTDVAECILYRVQAFIELYVWQLSEIDIFRLPLYLCTFVQLKVSLSNFSWTAATTATSNNFG